MWRLQQNKGKKVEWEREQAKEIHEIMKRIRNLPFLKHGRNQNKEQENSQKKRRDNKIEQDKRENMTENKIQDTKN